ncbi:hypothetical protein ABZ816_06215 [Actinosynnema sp. NPDC047251]|uniref:Uncharacterized protein n=1 Tax=Saccharothrix espanaensis (strain ATCC 51144 / DSM 44229 / JCM 9112 / NBRC 15066 / NRRL 15764) TaxID=1179773 RepID=K0JRH2_SACES|nr:hypothetical protein [Saccharothrix espanaensis]CCH27952.1 hypothetical protein BN6_06230 [Saccharothrix espanaensis DSM 44229]
MTSPADAVVRTSLQLRQLIERGFQFLHPRDSRGELAAVVGVRAHDAVIDVVRLHTEDDVVAIRMPADEVNVLSPTRFSWRRRGPATSVLDELLELPDDRIA